MRVGLIVWQAQMGRKKVWYPDKSLSLHQDSGESVGKSCNGEENSPTQASNPIVRRRTARIVRRKEPTVDVRAASALPECCLGEEESSGGYSTVETNPHKTLDLLEGSRVDKRESDTEMCGWRQDEHKLAESAQLKLSLRSTQLPREFPSSRLLSGTRMNTSRRKREQLYKFIHLDTVEKHMRQYNSLCSYTVSTAIAEDQSENDDEYNEERVCIVVDEGCQQSRATTRTSHRSNSRSRPPQRVTTRTSSKAAPTPISELAYRIGVHDSIRQPQLLKHRTPPSISKKRNEDRDDLVLQAQGQKRTPSKRHTVSGENNKQPKADNTNTTTHKKEMADQVPPSRPQTQANNYREKLPVLVSHSKPTSTSTISVSKYLQVNHSSSSEEKGEVVENGEIDGSTSTLSSPPSMSIPSYDDYSTVVHSSKPERATWPSFSSTAVDPLVDNLGKDEMLRRKADSLGLLSHKWAKSFLERGFMTGHLPHQLYHNLSRPTTKESTRLGDTQTDNTRQDTSRKAKMERLQSVYGKKTHKKYPSQSVAASNPATRPPTRSGDSKHTAAIHKLSHRLKDHLQLSFRPPSRSRDKHRKTSHITTRPAYKRWRNEGPGSPLTSTALEGLLGVAQQ